MASKLLNSYGLFGIISVVLLYMGFSLNSYGAADFIRHYDISYTFMNDPKTFPEFHFSGIFLTFDRWSESTVLGRLAKSRRDGLLSSGGFVGRFYGNSPDLPAGVDARRFEHAYQYKIYLDESMDSNSDNFYPYKSHFGGQALVLSVLDRVIGGDNSFKLAFYYHFMSAMSAIMISLIIFWFAKESGLFTGWLLIISYCLFCYPTLFAKSLWWALWAFYIPFVFFLYMLRREELVLKQFSNANLFAIGFFAMMIKMFFNGFEFICTVGFMTLVPLVYYALKNRWNYRLFLIRAVSSIFGISVAVLTSCLLLCMQFTLVDEKFGDGVAHLHDCFLRRTGIGNTVTATEVELEQRGQTNLSSILKYYVSAPVVVDLNSLGIKPTISTGPLLILFNSVAVLLFFVEVVCKRNTTCHSIKALIVSQWFSIIPPLSWFLLFKQHSFIHKPQDPIVWYMPYMFFGIALCGVSLRRIIGVVRGKLIIRNKASGVG